MKFFFFQIKITYSFPWKKKELLYNPKEVKMALAPHETCQEIIYSNRENYSTIPQSTNQMKYSRINNKTP